MSTENARKLVTKLQGNATLQAKVNTNLERAFAEVAAKEGFSCTLKEFNAAVKEISVGKTTAVNKRIGDKALVAIVSVAVV